jgi:hypothetical protein
MVMMAAVAGFSKRRLRVEEFLVFAAFLVFGFIARKNVPFFMIAMVPILSRLGAATTVSDWLRQSTSRKSSLLAQAFVIAIMLPLLMLTGVAIKDRGEKTFRRAFSVAALDFLVANKMTDRVMHGFDVGGYFAYSTGMKVFADRRTQLYGVPFVERYVNAMNGRPGYAEFIAAWNPKSILVPNDSPLKALLSATGQYGVVFDSGSDAILAKRGVGYDALITQYQHLPIKVALH